ncbi:YdcF family protein [Psychrobacter sp. 1044]|uniref:YdcF family protein n=1 Tax=Psychrobacter sp. 1044 TaxID=2772562 RepID=UPI00191B5C20|nr:YdcF family protein [Psychrobacter sp. 1044]
MSKGLISVIRGLLSVIGIILIIDCAALMVVGKVNFGSVVPFLVGIVFVIHGIFWHAIRRFCSQHYGFNRLWYGLWAVFILWLLSFVLFIWSLQQQIALSQQPAPTVAAIIILGSGTVAGKPTPTLAKRLDTAVPLIETQPDALVITSGGVGFQRTRSEADIMATYLHEAHGVPFERILQEGKSTSTEENLANSRALLEEKGLSITDPIAIVTSDFHSIRAASIARHQGYTQPITVASPTPLSIRYNAWFREYFAFVSGWLLGEY